MKNDAILIKLINKYNIDSDDYIELISSFQQELEESWKDGIKYGLKKAKEALAEVIIP